MTNEITTKGFAGPAVKLGSLEVGALVCRAGDTARAAYIKINHKSVVDLSNGRTTPLNGIEEVIHLNFVELVTHRRK